VPGRPPAYLETVAFGGCFISGKKYPEGQYRCDFVVGNIFLEFFGLVDASNIAPNYSEIIKKKRKICKKYSIPLIELYEKDLYNLDKTLGEKLKIKSKQEVLL